MNKKEIGERLRELREELNYSVSRMASKLGIERKRWERLEKGALQIRQVELIALSCLFNINPEWVLYGRDPKYLESSSAISFFLIRDIIRELKRIEDEYDIDIPPDLFAEAVETIYDEVMKELQKGEKDRQKLIKRGVGKIIKLAG